MRNAWKFGAAAAVVVSVLLAVVKYRQGDKPLPTSNLEGRLTSERPLTPPLTGRPVERNLIELPANLSSLGATETTSASAAEISILTADFNQNLNGRDFAEKYWLKPKDGGRFYAGKLMDQCQGIRVINPNLLTMAQPDITLIGEQNYLMASGFLRTIQGRCGQITGEDYARISGPIAHANTDGADPLIAASRSLTAGSIRDNSRANAIAAVLGVSDPLLMQDIGMRLSLYSSPTEGIYLYFEGKKFPVVDDPSLAAAYFLLPCGMGLNCSSGDVELGMRCLIGSGCYSNRFELVRARMSNGSETKYADILETYKRLLGAVRAKSVSSFVPPSAP
jgi:hypothetical protein